MARRSREYNLFGEAVKTINRMLEDDTITHIGDCAKRHRCDFVIMTRNLGKIKLVLAFGRGAEIGQCGRASSISEAVRRMRKRPVISRAAKGSSGKSK